MADADVAAAMAERFLGTLPSEPASRLLAAGDRSDYPTGTAKEPAAGRRPASPPPRMM